MPATLSNDVPADTWLAGVDGCAGGWVVALADREFTNISLRQIASFAELFSDGEEPSVAAVDMPIGLPEQTGPKGRTPERLVRPLLGARQSSVFSIPSRAAVYAGADPNESDERKRFLRACDIARATSAQGRAVAKQGFHIFRKIVDVDLFLQRRRDLLSRVFEVHPEVAFWRMNGFEPVAEPKKIKGKPNQIGIELRARLLVSAGVPANTVDIPLPKSVARDDWIDALASLVVARRLARGEATSFPAPPEFDRLGIPIAIWT
jgi:predicted RNase H-like nuclease